VLGDLVHEAAGTVFGRWYVTLFGVVFAWCAVRDLGWRRTVLYSLVALVVGGFAENGSVHFGVRTRATRSTTTCVATSCSSAMYRSWCR
jgi:hypothetical protein